MESEASVNKIENKIRNKIKEKTTKHQRDYYLNEQLKAIQKELGEDNEENELKELETKVNKLKLSEEAKQKALSELKKLKNMPPNSSEASVIRGYVEWLISVPWDKNSRLKKDLLKSQEILDKDHYGLEKVKERIIEYLAVQQRTSKVKGSIICLVGPPGVGKTSLGESIARATGRKFCRISLGGVKDEAEIRGHRRTYVGSQPGKIIQSMKKVKVSNPLILLDEIDKIASDWKGDPASALLEVLDPEQNNKFVDHYMEVEYDLSNVMFICTANNYTLPPALLDRMEFITLSGYTEEEKLEIAKRHLITKQRKQNGLKVKEWKLNNSAILDIIRYYTREAGVRGLEREISKTARKSLKQIIMDKEKSISVSPKNLNKFLGVKKFDFGLAEEKNQVGVVTGLAYTTAGGDTLNIEAILMQGKGKIKLTGKLGEVMQESIQTAYSFVKANSLKFSIEEKMFKDFDIHLHVPEGAVPKDGPSAGLAMVSVIVSALTNNKINKDIAMTGEVTLRGNALPIGGLKEKTMAALRAGIKTVIIPKKNKKDLEDISEQVKSKLKIVTVETVYEVLDLILTKKLKPLKKTATKK